MNQKTIFATILSPKNQKTIFATTVHFINTS